MAILQDLAARQAIADTLALHSRGVDRADAALLGAAYHPDATVDYGFFAGDAATLVTILADAQKGAGPTLHRTSNMWIRVDGDQAISESSVIALVDAPDARRVVLGRYLDRHACRDGHWRLTHRHYVLDGNINRAPGASGIGPVDGAADLAHYVAQGAKGASDPGRVLLALHAAQAAACPIRTETPMPEPTYPTPAPATADAVLDTLVARAAIHDLCMAYARGVDRADEALLASIFTDDATVISGVINGSGAEFASGITRFVREELDMAFHSIANSWVELRGPDDAVGEHYVIAHAVHQGQETTTGGRYIDRYVRRDGRWLIASRTFVADFSTSHLSSLQHDGFYEGLRHRGCTGPADPVYAHWSGTGE